MEYIYSSCFFGYLYSNLFILEKYNYCMIPKYAQQIYAVLWNKFGENEFSTKQLNFLDLFMSKGTKKKTLFLLTKENWIRRKTRSRYVCVNPRIIFETFFKPKVIELLKSAKMKWCFSRLNALEVYSDFSVERRSWISSPFYIKVLKRDLKKWINLFKKQDITVFIDEGKPQFGEYVVLIPKGNFTAKIVNNYPVEPLEDVIKFIKQRNFEFEYELNYLREKYGRIYATRKRNF